MHCKHLYGIRSLYFNTTLNSNCLFVSCMTVFRYICCIYLFILYFYISFQFFKTLTPEQAILSFLILSADIVLEKRHWFRFLIGRKKCGKVKRLYKCKPISMRENKNLSTDHFQNNRALGHCNSFYFQIVVKQLM